MPDPVKIPLSRIRLDGGTQPRVDTDDVVVAEYAEAYQDGADMPHLVCFDDGVSIWLTDGFHRYYALLRIKAKHAWVSLVKGTRRDAILFSCGMNTAHGLRRTNADKRRAVTVLLQDDEWGKWSDREISRRCGVNHEMVGAVRKSLSGGNRQIAENVRAATRTAQRGDSVYQFTLPEDFDDDKADPLPAKTETVHDRFALIRSAFAQMTIALDKAASSFGGEKLAKLLTKTVKDGLASYHSPQLATLYAGFVKTEPK